MKILLLNEHSEYILKAKAYCKENWEGVYYGFCTCLNEGMETTKNLPNTYIVLGGQNEDKILGFYQLNNSEYNEGHKELIPWITTIFVDPICRGGGFGEMLLNHAKYQVAKLGYDKVYLSTTHIGYYEKYGFEEIGMDVCS